MPAAVIGAAVVSRRPATQTGYTPEAILRSGDVVIFLSCACRGRESVPLAHAEGVQRKPDERTRHERSAQREVKCRGRESNPHEGVTLSGF